MKPTQLGEGVWMHDPTPWWLSFYDGQRLIGTFHVGKFQQILERMSTAGVQLGEEIKEGFNACYAAMQQHIQTEIDAALARLQAVLREPEEDQHE